MLTVTDKSIRHHCRFSLGISAARDRNGLLACINRLQDLVRFHDWFLAMLNSDDKTYCNFMVHAGGHIRRTNFPAADGFFDYTLEADRPVMWEVKNLRLRGKPQGCISLLAGSEIKRIAGMPLKIGNKVRGVLFLASEAENAFEAGEADLMPYAAAQFSIAVTNIRENEALLSEIARYKDRLKLENLYLQEEIQTTYNYSEVIGTSAPMRQVFQLVSQVADRESGVLIMGETGTGKELIARAIHNGSTRKDKMMVKVNCATLPANLIESELFGHEKGSFTGAIERRIGKFELANHSTLFLDEVGELPPELQAKLLRALQEKEIQRVGGKGAIKINVRIVAATNRNLQKEVQAGRFRSDLYFRLNVFPITVPALRDRREDIPILTEHFLVKHAKPGLKGPRKISSRALKELTAYSWPGNVRELEHLIERSILLAKGKIIKKVYLPLAEDDDIDAIAPGSRIKTINEVEREHIISVLKLCRGKVAGIGGAAEALKIPSTTLNSKIRRLKIKKGFN